MAPGGPGDKADWLPANKSGFGTSHTTLSKVWFTLEGGRLSEVYYPRLDTPSVRNLDLMITDGHSFAARAQDASSSTTRLVGPAVEVPLNQSGVTEGNALLSSDAQMQVASALVASSAFTEIIIGDATEASEIASCVHFGDNRFLILHLNVQFLQMEA